MRSSLGSRWRWLRSREEIIYDDRVTRLFCIIKEDESKRIIRKYRIYVFFIFLLSLLLIISLIIISSSAPEFCFRSFSFISFARCGTLSIVIYICLRHFVSCSLVKLADEVGRRYEIVLWEHFVAFRNFYALWDIIN